MPRPRHRSGQQAAAPISGPVRREKDIKLLVEIFTPPPTHPCRLGDAHPHPGLYSFGVEDRLQIGAVLFLPFLVNRPGDHASVTLSIGMVQLPPVMISAPFRSCCSCWWTAGTWWWAR